MSKVSTIFFLSSWLQVLFLDEVLLGRARTADEDALQLARLRNDSLAMSAVFL